MLRPLVAGEQITVAAAADLNYAMKDLAARFEQKTGDKVALTFGASGNFYSQIQSGAPYDLFFSADADYPGEAGRRRAGTSDRRCAPMRSAIWCFGSRTAPISILRS